MPVAPWAVPCRGKEAASSGREARGPTLYKNKVPRLFPKAHVSKTWSSEWLCWGLWELGEQVLEEVPFVTRERVPLTG